MNFHSVSKFCCKSFKNHISKITLTIIPRCPEPCIPRSQLEQSVKFIFRIGTESHSCQASTHLFTAVTTNTRPQRFFSSVETCGLVDVSQLLPWISRVGREKILSPFLEHSEEHVGLLNRFCNILPQDLTPVQNYEEYEFVECLSAKTQIIDLFTHYKLQPHKLSQYTLARSPFIQQQGNLLCQGA